MRAILLILALIPTLLCFGQKSEIKFNETSHHFGNIQEREGDVKNTFEFKNVGNNPLIINEIRTGCACTTAEFDKKPIAPGEVGTIRVSFDPLNRPGKFIKSLAVFANTSPSATTLTIRGFVIPQASGPYDNYPYKMGHIRMNQDSLNLGTITSGIIRHKTIDIINSSDDTVSLAIKSPEKLIKVTVSPEILAPQEKGNIYLKWYITDKEPLGPKDESVTLVQNNKEIGVIPITAELLDNFSMYKENYTSAPKAELSEKNFDMGEVAIGNEIGHIFTIANEGKNELYVKQIVAEDENVSVSVKRGIKAGKKQKITITLNVMGEPTFKTSEIKLYTNDPQNPVLTYTLLYEIVESSNS